MTTPNQNHPPTQSETTMTPDREKLLAKIRALLAKTQENGCTEGEAMAALAKAQEWMEAYEIGAVDLQEPPEKATIETRSERDPDGIRAGLANSVARFCECRAWGRADDVSFCGMESDSIFAHWLLEALAAFVVRTTANYRVSLPFVSSPRERSFEVRSFRLGCVNRIAARLNELAAARRRYTGNALVVSKQALITAKLAVENIQRRNPSVDHGPCGRP